MGTGEGDSVLPAGFRLGPVALAGELESLPFLARGEADSRPLATGLASGPGGVRPRLLGGLRGGSPCRGIFRGGVSEPRFMALFWGDREEAEELPEDERERRLLTGERLRLCLGPGGGRLGGLLRLGDILRRGLWRRRGEYDLERDLGRRRERERERERWRGRSLRPSFSRSRGLGFSSFLGAFSGDDSFTSITESGFISLTKSLVEDASWTSGSGLELSD